LDHHLISQLAGAWQAVKIEQGQVRRPLGLCHCLFPTPLDADFARRPELPGRHHCLAGSRIGIGYTNQVTVQIINREGLAPSYPNLVRAQECTYVVTPNTEAAYARQTDKHPALP
jgi:hypothetical protein